MCEIYLSREQPWVRGGDLPPMMYRAYVYLCAHDALVVALIVSLGSVDAMSIVYLSLYNYFTAIKAPVVSTIIPRSIGVVTHR